MTEYFTVVASNIIHDTSETYGPFLGRPSLTYEFLRDGNGDHIFSYREERPDDPGWEHEEPGNVTFGWRRCYDSHPDHKGFGQFGVEAGPYWTDLMIDTFASPNEMTFHDNYLPEETP